MNAEHKEVKPEEEAEELVFENKNINALIKGVETDLETLKKENETTGGRSADIVRFTIELNILQDKKRRNLAAINQLIKNHSQHIMRMPSFNPAPENSTGHENKSRLHRLAAIKGRLIEITRQLNGTMSQIERKPLLDELFELTKEELALEYGDSTTTGMTHFTTEEEKRSANDSQPQNENLVA